MREACTVDGFDPFDVVTLTRERGPDGEPTSWYVIEGLRQGGERSYRVKGTALWEQADMHLWMRHGKTLNQASSREFHHAIIRAAVAFLID